MRSSPALAAIATLLALSTSSGSAGNPPATQAALGAPQEPLSYDEALAAGLPVPIFDPNLPICPDVIAPGFETAQEMESAVDDDAKAVCQADFRKAVVRVGPGRRVENLVEIYSEDATPHPSFGGGGITLQNGMLKTTPSSFTLWTTAYGTPTVYAQSPYVISWTSQWSDFKACRDSC